jgi:hypothetical protein
LRSLRDAFKNLKQNTMKKKTIAAFLLLVFISSDVWAFCGFYVSKADGTLTNKTSQVIMVRDGDRTVITMSNDFKGDVTDFAMVVPVPTVLKKSDIKVVEADLFQRLNDYSKPRLVEYYDQNPCHRYYAKDQSAALNEVVVTGMAIKKSATKEEKEYKVTVEATYTVGEYDIVILSAEESNGLYKWLTANKYKIPKNAEEVLEPYIKSNMKFFVVKVNVEEQENLGFEQLRPIQIKFNSPKFMLPIRLGMANADGDQDMVVYAFTRNGRVESTNYRTVQMPTAKNIPLFVNTNFGSFYANAFQHQWMQQNQNSLFLEYAWDVSPSNFMKCDPCVSDPPNFEDLKKAGVWWLGKDAYNDYVNQYEIQKQNVFFTRLHVRYNRKNYAQDLVFQETPNRENYQARYIITHPATGDLNCEAGRQYLKELKERRKKEMEMLSSLTGKGYDDWDVVSNIAEDAGLSSASYASVQQQMKTETPIKETGKNVFMASMALLSMATMIGVSRKRKA